MSVIYTPNDWSWNGDGLPEHRTTWQVFDKIQAVQAYRVGSQLYLTPKAAAKKIAWSMIFTKYCNQGDLVKIEDIKKVYRYTCDCAEDHERGDWGQVIGFKHECCQIHERKTGYFARLHARLVRILLAIYAAPEAGQG